MHGHIRFTLYANDMNVIHLIVCLIVYHTDSLLFELSGLITIGVYTPRKVCLEESLLYGEEKGINKLKRLGTIRDVLTQQLV